MEIGDFVEVTAINEQDACYYAVGMRGVITEVYRHGVVPHAYVNFRADSRCLDTVSYLEGAWFVNLSQLKELG